MITLIKWLIFGHLHKWKTVGEQPLRLTRDGKQVGMGSRYIQQCEACGVVKKRDFT